LQNEPNFPQVPPVATKPLSPTPASKPVQPAAPPQTGPEKEIA
jgi:hypothetical protein